MDLTRWALQCDTRALISKLSDQWTGYRNHYYFYRMGKNTTTGDACTLTSTQAVYGGGNSACLSQAIGANIAVKRRVFVRLKGVSYVKPKRTVEDILWNARIDYGDEKIGSDRVLFALSPRTLILCL
jgi:hypothetical protein